jgi:hypothetical protein
MADISDITAYLAATAAGAVYPNGSSNPSVAGIDVRIFEGWPIADQIDNDLTGFMLNAAGVKVARPNGVCANVSVFPMLGAGKPVYQILDETYVIRAPQVTTTVAVAGQVITVTGTLAAKEFLTVVLDDAVVLSRGGANVAAMLTQLAADAVAAGYAATATATTLTIPFKYEMTVRQGGEGILGKVIHRQSQSVMITVWAPTQATRAALAKAIDVAVKKNIRVTMPDTSQAIVVFSRTNVIDDDQAKGLYRRDLIFDVDYATVEQFAGTEITSTKVSIANIVDNSAIAIAIT